MTQNWLKPKLLIIGPVPPPYIGPAVATYRLLESSILNQQFDIEFLDTSDQNGQHDIGAFTMHNTWQAFRHGMDCFRAIRRMRPDLLYIPISRGFWGFLRDFVFLSTAKLHGVEILAHLRAGRFDLRHDYGFAGRMLAKAGMKTVSRGLALGECLKDIFGDDLPQEHVRIIHNGMNLEGWEASEWQHAREMREGFTITYVANLRRDKGAQVLLKALPVIREKVPGVQVVFAGNWCSEDFRVECMALVEENHLHDCVRFTGGVEEEEKRELLANADLSVFVPVKPEGSPWVVLEAMAAGLPVIGTAQGTMQEVIVEGQTGFIVEPDNAAALAAKVSELAHNPELRRTLGANGRHRVETVYTESNVDRALANVALEVMADARLSKAARKQNAFKLALEGIRSFIW